MDGRTASALPAVDFDLSIEEEHMLAALVEVIIPATTTPGAILNNIRDV